MILPDINLLVYAYNADAPHHRTARIWWEETLSQGIPVGLPWAVICGFIRLLTDNRILRIPLSAGVAVEHVESWLAQPGVSLLHPGPQHLTILRKLFAEAGTAGRLTTDIHLAALAIEYHAELHTNDRDFERFKLLRHHNPLE